MNPAPNRIVIYAKDVMRITGRRERAAYKLLAGIRKRFGKDKRTFITVEEFCQHTGLKEEHVSRLLL